MKDVIIVMVVTVDRALIQADVQDVIQLVIGAIVVILVTLLVIHLVYQNVILVRVDVKKTRVIV
mgnify:CR=1 FL=1